MQSLKKLKKYAFIDSQNLNLGLKNVVIDKVSGKILHSGWSLDFKKFRIYLKEKYKVEKAYLFIGFRSGNENLYKYLQESGYICIFKPTVLQNGIIKGNCDAELVLHTMIELNNYDKAIIVSGDGDFHCLIEYLLEQNKLEKVFIPNRFTYSVLLKKFRSHLVYLNVPEIEEKIKKDKSLRSLRTEPFDKRETS